MGKTLFWLHVNQQLAFWSAAVPFAVSLAATALVIVVAHRFGLMAKPRAERWHQRPTALFGGVAIFLATALGWAAFLPRSPGFIALASGSTLVFLSGLFDDFRSLRPAQKVVPQFLVACLFAAVFYRHVSPNLVWLIPVAIFWIVGITNAINLLDNMDGLSAGVSVLCALLMAAHAAWMGDSTVALGAIVLAGAAGGFLVFNFNPARVFMGDCGSMFLGFSLACLSLMGRSGLLSGNLFTALLLPTLVLATPLFDTLFVALMRYLNGRPISQGGRDHTSHRLVMLGLSERRAVLWLYGITLWFGLIALWGSIARNWLATLTITVFSWVALLVLGLFLAEVQTYSEEEFRAVRERRENKVVLSRVIRNKRRLAEAILDCGAIIASWFAAFLLHYDGALDTHVRELGIALPYVVGAQLLLFFACGLYRNAWRYVDISDLLSIVRAVACATVATWLLLLFVVPAPGVKLSIILLDSLLLLLSLGGMRLGMKALRFHFALKWRDGVRRVLVYGAGDAGELAVREMLQNRELHLQPVGFVDDDPSKQRLTIHGLKVLGTHHALLELVDSLQIDEVVIAASSNHRDTVREVVQLCQGEGILWRETRGMTA